MNVSERQQKLDNIAKKIEAMMKKTVENGCIEAEALAATEKVKQLLTDYDLTIGEVTQRTDDYDEVRIITDSSIRSHVHFLVHYIGELTDTMGYNITTSKKFKNTKTGKLFPKIYCFFGQKKDIKVAEYLYHLFDKAIERESLTYKFSPECRLSKKNSRSKMASFTNGLQMRLIERIQEMIDRKGTFADTQALVLCKKETTKQKFEDINEKLN